MIEDLTLLLENSMTEYLCVCTINFSSDMYGTNTCIIYAWKSQNFVQLKGSEQTEVQPNPGDRAKV